MLVHLTFPFCFVTETIGLLSSTEASVLIICISLLVHLRRWVVNCTLHDVLENDNDYDVPASVRGSSLGQNLMKCQDCLLEVYSLHNIDRDIDQIIPELQVQSLRNAECFP